MTLVSDLPRSGRLAYVGVDNRAAGRLAGEPFESSGDALQIVEGALASGFADVQLHHPSRDTIQNRKHILAETPASLPPAHPKFD